MVVLRNGRRFADEEGIVVATLVEHVMRAVVRFADRVIVLHLGSRILEGSPEEVLRNPLMEEVYLGRRLSL